MSITRRLLAFFSFLAVASGAGFAGVRRHHARPQIREGLPQADYISRNPPSKVGLALSQTAVLIPKPGPPPQPDLDGIIAEYFQLGQGKLQVEQCSISRVALILSSRGTWTLSLRADQNPAPQVGPASPRAMASGAGAITKQTGHIKRNLFMVRVRGYGASTVNAGVLDGAPGRPLLCDLCPPSFWVQSGVPEFLSFSGTHPLDKDISLIDRVEVELRYR